MKRSQNVISGTVRDPQGNPIAQARVYLTKGPVSLPDIAALTDNNGRFSMSVPSSGFYEIQGASDAFKPASATVQVTGDQETYLEITLEK